jgi:hypothetical protein
MRLFYKLKSLICHGRVQLLELIFDLCYNIHIATKIEKFKNNYGSLIVALFFVGISFPALLTISRAGAIKECNYSKSNVNQVSVTKQDENLVAIVSPTIISGTSTQNSLSVLSIPESFYSLGEVKDPGIIMADYSRSNNLIYSNQKFAQTFAVINF